jgi:hypothetical protein
MLAAFNDDSNVVTGKQIAEAVEELQWVEFSARKVTAKALPHDDGEADPPDWATATTASNGGSAPPVGRPLGRLILSRGGTTVAERRLHVGRVIIGRTSANDLQVDSRFISRHHCQIMSNASSSVLEDLNSTNGVFIKSKRVRHHNLNDGDVISLGDHELVYVDERPGSRSARDQVDTGRHAMAGQSGSGAVEDHGATDGNIDAIQT